MQSAIPKRSLPLSPREDAVLYHKTTESVDTLLNEGVLAGECSYVTKEHDVLDEVAEEEDISYPVNRRNVSYWWPCVEPLNRLNTPPEEWDGSGLQQSTSGVIASFDALDSPVYVASMTAMSDLIDSQYMDEFDPIESGRRYLESIEKATTWDEVRESATRFEYPEVMVPVDVSPDAIIGTFE